MAPSKDNDPRRQQDEESSSSSWFSSWFERDMRDEIHEQLNALDERKKHYEQAQEERRRFLQQHAASSAFPFPFFVPPEHDHNNNNSTGSSNNNGGGHWDDFEEFFGGRIPRPRWQDHGAFDGEQTSSGDRRRGRSPWDSDVRENRQRDQESIEDLHREMQNMFEAAFGGGRMPPQGGTRSGSWTSSSTVVSSSNGTSYTMKQDSQNGARVDLQLPKHCQSENLSLEVLRDSPCLIRWKNHNHKDDDDDTARPRSGRSPNEQILELGNSVDCSRLSASISEAQRTLTVQAPPRGRDGDEEERTLSLKPSSYPRPVRVTKKQ